jgi:hypothetical protein
MKIASETTNGTPLRLILSDDSTGDLDAKDAAPSESAVFGTSVLYTWPTVNP